MIRRASPWLLLLILSSPTPAAGISLRSPGGDELRLPGDLDPPKELQSIAFGEHKALAFAVDSDNGGRIGSVVEIYDTNGERQRVELGLRIRDLLWLTDGRLLAVGFRAARRTPGEAFLLQWDAARSRFKRVMHLPPTARDLAYGNRAELLLLTARDELRTIILPELQSGPLYRVLGDNRSATVVDGDRVLVGQSEALLLLELTDRQSRERMPIREQVAVDAPVEQLSASAGGQAVLAGLLDGRVFGVQFDPLRLEAAGEGLVVAAFAPPPDRDSPRAAKPPIEPAVEPGEELPVEPPPVEMPAVEVAVIDLPTAAESVGPTASATAVVATVPIAGAQIHGRLSGPASSAVLAVVAFGPDSVLREAARIRPNAEGVFAFDRLPAGRYRIQLDGGGARLIVSEPNFQIVNVTGESETSLEFRVLQAL